jgi:hypothetical protein
MPLAFEPNTDDALAVTVPYFGHDKWTGTFDPHTHTYYCTDRFHFVPRLYGLDMMKEYVQLLALGCKTLVIVAQKSLFLIPFDIIESVRVPNPTEDGRPSVGIPIGALLRLERALNHLRKMPAAGTAPCASCGQWPNPGDGIAQSRWSQAFGRWVCRNCVERLRGFW